MTDVVAVLTGGDAEKPVTDVAAAVAAIVDAGVRPVSVAGLDARRAAGHVLRALHSPGGSLGVLARDERTRQLWEQVVERAARPVILVPVLTRPAGVALRRVLMPLDGTAGSTAAVAGLAAQFARAGLDLVVLHVFDTKTNPMFWDQPAHAGHAWAEEFRSRHCAHLGARLEVRIGVAAEHVLDVARTEHADMIALSTTPRDGPHLARTVRRTLADAAVPVVVVPTAPEGPAVRPASPDGRREHPVRPPAAAVPRRRVSRGSGRAATRPRGGG